MAISSELQKCLDHAKGRYSSWERKDRDFRKYFEILFPTVKRIFDENSKQEVQKPPELMISLVGLSVVPVVLSILAQKPKELYFIFTEESEGFRAILTEEINKDKDWKKTPKIWHKTVKDPSDPVNIYLAIKEVWDEYQKIGVKAEDVALDITGGKKTMAGGAFTAASIHGFDIWYVDSEVDEDGRQRQGTEHYHSILSPMKVFSQKDMGNAQELFDNCHYEAAHELLQQALDNLDDDKFRRYISGEMRTEVEKLATWAECYMHWDNMEYERAKAVLDNAPFDCADEPQYKFIRILAPLWEIQKDIGNLLETWDRKNELNLPQKTSRIFERIFDENWEDGGKRLVFSLALDMYFSARRRQRQGNYDDAIIRMARTVDICAHYSFCRLNSNTRISMLGAKLKFLMKEQDSIYKEELWPLIELRNSLAPIHNIKTVRKKEVEEFRSVLQRLLKNFGSDYWQSLWGVDDFDALECLLQFRSHEKIYSREA